MVAAKKLSAIRRLEIKEAYATLHATFPNLGRDWRQKITELGKEEEMNFWEIDEKGEKKFNFSLASAKMDEWVSEIMADAKITEKDEDGRLTPIEDHMGVADGMVLQGRATSQMYEEIMQPETAQKNFRFWEKILDPRHTESVLEKAKRSWKKTRPLKNLSTLTMEDAFEGPYRFVPNKVMLQSPTSRIREIIQNTRSDKSCSLFEFVDNIEEQLAKVYESDEGMYKSELEKIHQYQIDMSERGHVCCFFFLFFFFPSSFSFFSLSLSLSLSFLI
jgi:hypothetical protein